LRLRTLYHRDLAFYWRTSLATVLGVTAAASALIGALLVGDAMRGSLRDLAIDRLGLVDHALVSGRFFRESVAPDIAADGAFQSRFSQACPAILVRGAMHHADSGACANRINVLGVDDRFWHLGRDGIAVDERSPSQRSVLLNQTLAQELGAAPGDDVLVRLARQGDVPGEVLFGRPDRAPLSLRLKVRGVIPAKGLGNFGLNPTQVQPNNAYVPLATLQRALKQRGRCNVLLVAGGPDANASGSTDTDRLQHLLDERIRLADLGLQLRHDDGDGCVVLESKRFLLGPAIESAAFEAAQSLRAACTPVLAYLANTIAIEPPKQTTSQSTPTATAVVRDNASTRPAARHEIPYATVAAMDWPPNASATLASGDTVPVLGPGEILLNKWAADDLGARPDDRIGLSYYVQGPFGRLRTERTAFRLRGVVRMQGLAASRSLVPEYEGVTDAKNVTDWDPPFPIDLNRIREKDERYWDDHGPTPKAFISLETGQRLWAQQHNRFGRLTSVRIGLAEGMNLSATAGAFEKAILRHLPGRRTGLAFEPIRARALAASEGSSDFAMLFLGFSFFLIVSAAMLIALMFRLGVEHRSSEIGLLLASGFSPRRVTRLLLVEGALLAGIGSAIGVVGAMGYAWLMLAGLRSWWSEAVNAPFLTLHVEARSLLVGVTTSVIVGLLSITWAVRGMGRMSPWALLAGNARTAGGVAPAKRMFAPAAIAVFALAVAVALAGVAMGTDLIGESPASFGSGAAMLIAGVAAVTVWTRRRPPRTIAQPGPAALALLGIRNAARHPRRSLLTTGLIACATFILVVVGANRHETGEQTHTEQAGTGGFALIAESAVPILHDLNTVGGREKLNLSPSTMDVLDRSRVMPFRLQPGDETSCLNLYRPDRPRILGATKPMIDRGGFQFAASLAQTDQEGRNPWTLLDRKLPDGAVPAIGDYNTVMWLLHLGLGQDLTMNDHAGRPIRLRVVGMLSGSVLQGELVIAESRFLELFPSVSGYRVFLVDTPVGDVDRARTSLEADLGDYGFDAIATVDRLSAYHVVENAYLTTFQTLGGLGMVLGTFGLAAVLLRNVFERRGELALMRSLGFRRWSLAWMVLTENAVMLLAGLGIGVLSAVLAIMPHLASKPSAIPWTSLGVTLAAILLTGTAAGAVAVASTLRSPLLPALRTE